MKTRGATAAILLLLAAGLPPCAQEPGCRIGGKPYDRQVFDGNGRQVTAFGRWERISGIHVSPDGTRLLVWHRPDRARAYLITLYDLRTGAATAEIEPGFACHGVRWTPGYLVYVWGTTGGGVNFEYRDYATLEVKRRVNAFQPFEDQEGDILIEASYFYGDGKVKFHRFSDGSGIREFDLLEELGRKGIKANAASVQDIAKAGPGKYKFSVEYMADGSDTPIPTEIELGQ